MSNLPPTLALEHFSLNNDLLTSPELLECPDLGNRDLPIYQQKSEFLDAIDNHQVVIITAPTGNGKSTQIAQYLLEAGFDSVINTQPRRPAAQNVANRIHAELAELLGAELAEQLVSYQTGAGRVGSKTARIRLVTEQLLLNQDAYQPSDGDNEVWVLDEWHEANDKQFMLGELARMKIARNPNFRVVVMSATLDKQKEIEYWTNDQGVEPAVIESAGATTLHEITTLERPESNTAQEAIRAAIDIHANPDSCDGSKVIQVFESGKKEIKDTIDAILAGLPEEIAANAMVIPNHAKLSPREQAQVLEPYEGIKIIVQTNIAKTSLTIPGTRYVISSGRERTMSLDEEDVEGLFEYESTQDSLLQEKGRGGRTNESIFILTRHKDQVFIGFADRPAFMEPEITRCKLDPVALHLALRGLNLRTFRGLNHDKINLLSIDRAFRRLQALGAIDGNEEITALGRRMAAYPTKSENQRALVEAEHKSNNVKLNMAAMIAVMEVGGIKLYDKDRGRRWETLSEEGCSDALAQLDTFIAIQELFKTKKLQQLEEYDLDIGNIIKADELFRKIAGRFGIYDSLELKVPNADEREALRNCLLAGYANSVYLPVGEKMFAKLGATASQEREISNRSVVSPYTPSPILAMPRNVEMYKDGAKIVKPITEQVTEVSYEVLGRLATQLTVWQPVALKLRKNGYVQVLHQIIGSKVIGQREEPAESSPAVRAAAITHVKRNPGEHVRSLYTIKSQLEMLAHKAKTPISMLSNDDINGIIEQAALDTLRHPSHIEHNVRLAIETRGITLDSYVTAEDRAAILRNAPDAVKVGDINLKLRYRKGKAYAASFSLARLEELPEELMLEDGRTIYFIHDDRQHTIAQLKNRAYREGWLY